MAWIDVVNEWLARAFRGVNREVVQASGETSGSAVFDIAQHVRDSNHSVHDAMREPGTRIYGHRGTIHATEELHVEVSPDGEVVAVWFRCQHLPFKQVFADRRRSNEMREVSRGAPRLVAVEVIDKHV